MGSKPQLKGKDLVVKTKRYSKSNKLPINAHGARARNAKRNPNGYIYCIELKELGYYKIGVSVRLERRFIDIASSSPFKLKLLFSYSFEHRHIRKEWFKLNEKEVELMRSDLKKWSDTGLVLTRKK